VPVAGHVEQTGGKERDVLAGTHQPL